MARILVVEDNSYISAMLEDTLSEEGHAVLAAANQAEAIRVVAAERLDLVLTDLLGSPHDDRTRRYVAALVDAAGGAPVVVLTGWDRSLLSWAADLGLAAIIAKPIDLDNLLRTLDAALAG